MIAAIITPWAGDGQSVETAYHPQLIDSYPDILRYSDITDQPAENITPTPNLFAAEFEMDAATLAAIESDGNYLILWSAEQ